MPRSGGRVRLGAGRDAVQRSPPPYTETLLGAVPALDAERARPEIILEGDVPGPLRVPPGCRFHPRCPKRMVGIRASQEPRVLHVGTDHEVACHLHAETPVGACGASGPGRRMP